MPSAEHQASLGAGCCWPVHGGKNGCCPCLHGGMCAGLPHMQLFSCCTHPPLPPYPPPPHLHGHGVDCLTAEAAHVLSHIRDDCCRTAKRLGSRIGRGWAGWLFKTATAPYDLAASCAAHSSEEKRHTSLGNMAAAPLGLTPSSSSSPSSSPSISRHTARIGQAGSG